MIAKNEYKTSQNVTKVALFLGLFIEIPQIKGYMRIRNVHYNWLAKNATWVSK